LPKENDFGVISGLKFLRDIGEKMDRKHMQHKSLTFIMFGKREDLAEHIARGN